MSDELINANEIYLQDVICTVVSENKSADDFVIYNMVSTMVDIPNIDTTKKILNLIKMNRTILTN